MTRLFVSLALMAALLFPSMVLAERWTVIAAGENGVGAGQGQSKGAAKSAALSSCNKDDGKKCGAWARGNDSTYLAIVRCPVSNTKKGSWGGYSNKSLAAARAQAMKKLVNAAAGSGWILVKDKCEMVISSSLGKVKK